MAQMLATKYRPQTFEEIIGQDSIITILQRQIDIKQIRNTYLFCGPSGTGKTTLARCFANKINNGIGNPIEIDGASNNGVDNVKQLIQEASARVLAGTYKVYIIDEAHALTSQAWQAFLKCIEEPPEYTIFIFCTTDPQKIPATILNRVMRFNFNRVTNSLIEERLKTICQTEGYTNYEEACVNISRLADGSVRSAIALLNKCGDYNSDLSINNIVAALGNFSYKNILELINAFIDGNEKVVLSLIDQVYQTGSDLKLYVDQVLQTVLDIDKYYLFGTLEMTKIPSIYEDDIKHALAFDSPDKYYSYLINRLMACKSAILHDTNIKMTIEVYFLNICRCQ